MNHQKLRLEIEAVNDSDDALQIAADVAATAALASSQAAAIRFNNTLATINTTIRTGAASFANDFVSDLEKGDTILQSLQDAAANLGKTLQTAGLNSLVNSGLNSIAGPTAGATSSATILTNAGTSLAASMVSGATTAAGILSGGGTAAGVGVDAGTSLGGAELVTSGATAGGFIATAAAALGISAATLAAVMGPLAALAAVAAGRGMTFGESRRPPHGGQNERENNERDNYSKAA